MREQMNRAELPLEWRPEDRFVATCARCGCEGLKTRMTALYTKRTNTDMRVLCHVCKTCYIALLEELGVSER